jgi:hypothetical protein
MVNETGLNRNKLMLNPASLLGWSEAALAAPISLSGEGGGADGSGATSRAASKRLCRAAAAEVLQQCYAFGQLLGVVIRSQSVLEVDLTDTFWKQLLEQPLEERELAAFDYTAWSNLQFRDPRDGHEFSEEEFTEYYSDLTWTATLSDGQTRVELRPGGRFQRVAFAERWQYAREVCARRFEESALQMHHIRCGLQAVVPAKALALLSWRELSQRVCGDSRLNIDLLRRRTVYAPARYTHDHPVVQNFWRCLESFSPEEQGKFLQFAWARSRLPPANEADATWRLKVNILEAALQDDLPTSETCFFNLNLPRYDSYELMRTKLLFAIHHCSSITS